MFCCASDTGSFGNGPVPTGNRGRFHRNGAKSPLPQNSSARGSPIPAGIGCRGRIARASPMGKGRSMRPFPIKNERGQNYRLTQSGKNTWGGTPLTNFRRLFPTDCPVDSRVAAQPLTECLLQQFAMVALQQPVDCDNLRIAATCENNILCEVTA